MKRSARHTIIDIHSLNQLLIQQVSTVGVGAENGASGPEMWGAEHDLKKIRWSGVRASRSRSGMVSRTLSIHSNLTIGSFRKLTYIIRILQSGSTVLN